jgi:hypothetical protein
MNIQDELQKIHHQYGTSEKANYEIQKLFDNQHLEKTKIRVHGESLEENKLEELIRPLLKHLCNNYHPHVTLIINPTKFELLEGLKTSGYIDDYVRD